MDPGAGHGFCDGRISPMSTERTDVEATEARKLRLPPISGPLLGLIIVLILFVVLIWWKDPRELKSFVGVRNLQVLVQECTVPGVAALGMLLVIISGGIDLSVGSVVALVTVVAVRTYDNTGGTHLSSLMAVLARRF